MAVVTMGGLTGGGGRLLGALVAQRLGADYVDRLILTDTARHVGATVEALHQRAVIQCDSAEEHDLQAEILHGRPRARFRPENHPGV